MNNKTKAQELEQKARALRQKSKKKTVVKVKTDVPKLNKYYIHARARRVIEHEAQNLIDVTRWILAQVPAEDIYEIHDDQDRLLWGRSTELNPEVYTDDKHGVKN